MMKAGIKTTYYLRSRPATRMAKTTIGASATQASPPIAPSVEDANSAVVCSLENPEDCEACQ
jgi:ribonucleoside-diphosphate reductase alpha chain